MVISTNSSVSSLDISVPYCRPADDREGTSSGACIVTREPLCDSRQYDPLSDTESLRSLQISPAHSSRLQLSETSDTGRGEECTCVCPSTGQFLGPPCRLCRASEYNMIQESQARKKRRQDRFQSIKSTVFSKLSDWSHALHWSKRKQASNFEEGRNPHTKKDSLISWPESEATCVADEVENAKAQEHEASESSSEKRGSLSSLSGRMSMRGSLSKGFSRIPDTDEEKEARKEEKKRKKAESYRAAGALEDLYWHDERGMLDWRVVWAMGTMF